MIVEKSGPGEKECAIGNGADPGAGTQVLPDPGHRLMRNEMVRITTGADDDPVDHRCILHRMRWLDRNAVGRLNFSVCQADRDPVVARTPGKSVGGTQWLDDRTEGHHRKILEYKDGEGDRCG